MTDLRVLLFTSSGNNIGSGSCTVWTKNEKYVDMITAYHVIENAATAAVTDPSIRDLPLPVTILGGLPKSDVAVIRLHIKGLQTGKEGTLTQRIKKLVDEMEELRTPVELITKSVCLAEGFPANLPEETTYSDITTLDVFNDGIAYKTAESYTGGISGGSLKNMQGEWLGMPFAGIRGIQEIGFSVTFAECLTVAERVVQEYQGEFVNLSNEALRWTTKPDIGDRIQISDFQTLLVVETAFIGIFATLEENGKEGPVVPLDFWMKTFPEDVYPILRNGTQIGSLTKTVSVNRMVRQLVPGSQAPDLITVNGAHLVQLTEQHLDMYPQHKDINRHYPRLIVMAARDPEDQIHVGELVETINGEHIATVDDVVIRDGPIEIITTRGHWITEPDKTT